MKCVILAGGLGTRISEETETKPKPMVEIGGKPILWHVMKIYASYGISDFIVCLGYKGTTIKDFFANYKLHTCDVTIHLKDNVHVYHNKTVEDWNVTLIDTGVASMTGGRLKRIQHLIQKGPFCMTYGDGVGDVDVGACIQYHREHGKWATVTAVQPTGRFGALSINHENSLVESFLEKPQGDGGFINGGFFVLEPEVFDLIDNDQTVWEQEPMKKLAKQKQLMAFEHRGFWQPMDTLRDKKHLEELWNGGKAPWKIWS